MMGQPGLEAAVAACVNGGMDRRAFLLLTLAGAADPTPPPEPPDSIGALLLAPPPAPVDTGSERFDAWARDFIDRAGRAGLPADILNREFQGLKPDPRVEALDSRQPEFSKPVGDYVRGVVTEARVAAGQAKRADIPALSAIEQQYAVPAEILISIWAVESAFGTQIGDFDVLRSLATLAAAGRRRDWAEDQITAVIHIIASGQATRAQLRGSWAGAMGQTQFEPTAYLDDAVDGDGDGRRDIWGSSVDALASAANLLAKAGWRRSEPWQREVRLPAGFDYSLAEGQARSQTAWAAIGARPADAGGWPGADTEAPAQLLLPAGWTGPAFLAFPNHFVIRKYNNAMSYALAVGLLADRIAGKPSLAAAWPAETPLSLADRIAAQQALGALKYDPGPADGVIGANTRAALRAWQKAKGLPADGYLSVDMVLRLQTDAAPLAGAAGASTAAPQQP
jgi:membrane-bound lytic murein transglycosylase B